MNYNGKEIEFPAKTQLSFLKLIEKLEGETNDGNSNNSALLASCLKHPVLKTGIAPSDFDESAEIIKQLSATLFPEVLKNNEIKGLIPPFEFKPFYVSKRFGKILENAGEEFHFEMNDFNEDQLYIFGCATILSFYYQYPFLMTLPTLVDIPIEKGGMVRTYRLLMNGDLLEILPTEKSIPITHEDYLELISDFDNISLWKKKFPPNSWIMKGVGMVNLFDVTMDQSISKITSRLLTNSLGNLDELLEDMKKFLAINQLSMGFLASGEKGFTEDIHGLKNLILQDENQFSYKETLCANSYKTLIQEGKPIVITDVKKWNKSENCSVVSSIIEKLSFGSYIMVPIMLNDENLGFLELGSPETYELNGSTLLKVNLLLPTIAMALSRNRNEMQNKVEAIIQQECTTIHPAVKWRFEEEAVKFIQNTDPEEKNVFKDIVFSNVYPLFGQLDIKNSSGMRNDAMTADLTFQLVKIKNILTDEFKRSQIHIYEEMIFRVDDYIEGLKVELHSGMEQSISFFLENDVHPLFKQLTKKNLAGSSEIKNYLDQLIPGQHTIYNLRKKYDRSVNTINLTLAALLDKKQNEAQQMFPHYFERFKTDGVEYNIYIGKSITKKKDFDPIYLQNLQLWQLITTCELEREFLRIKNQLGMDLEIASLILVYSNSLSIQFRMDEKRFDVEGAYNARYEIIKKRIDKAHVNGTNERITCPGKIAILYTNDQEELMYTRYINFLEKKGYVEQDSKELLDVESLQGLAGLKAIRIKLKFD